MLCCVDGTFADESDSAVIFLLLRATDAFRSLVVTIMLFVGGARLRRLRTSGASLIRIALWIGLIGGAMFIALMVAGVAFAVPSDVGEGVQSPSESTAATLVQTAQLIVGFCEMLFMVFSLIWLTRHQRKLPLTPGT
jgi:membrane-bound ClpP family serine protease